MAEVKSRKVLVFDEDVAVVKSIVSYLSDVCRPDSFADQQKASEAVAEAEYDLVFSSVDGKTGEGFEFIDNIRQAYPVTKIVGLFSGKTIPSFGKMVASDTFHFIGKGKELSKQSVLKMVASVFNPQKGFGLRAYVSDDGKMYRNEISSQQTLKEFVGNVVSFSKDFGEINGGSLQEILEVLSENTFKSSSKFILNYGLDKEKIVFSHEYMEIGDITVEAVCSKLNDLFLSKEPDFPNNIYRALYLCRKNADMFGVNIHLEKLMEMTFGFYFGGKKERRLRGIVFNETESMSGGEQQLDTAQADMEDKALKEIRPTEERVLPVLGISIGFRL